MNMSGGAEQKAGRRSVKAEEGPGRGQYSTGGHPHQSEKETSGNKSIIMYESLVPKNCNSKRLSKKHFFCFVLAH
jgi:hypothetical protein